MDCLVPTHLGEDNTHQRQQAGAQVGCSHEVRARVWEAPAAGSTPDYSAHRQARPITVCTPRVLKASTVSCSFERGCTLLPCSICVSARIHHQQVNPGTPSSKTRLTIYSSALHALPGQECPKHDSVCVWVMSEVCPRGNEVIIRVKFWVWWEQASTNTLTAIFQSISECAKTLKPLEFMFAGLGWVYLVV